MKLFVNDFTLTGTPTKLATLYNTQYDLDNADPADNPEITYLGFKGSITAIGGAVTLTDQDGRSVLLAQNESFVVDGIDLANVLASGNTFTLRLKGVTASGW